MMQKPFAIAVLAMSMAVVSGCQSIKPQPKKDVELTSFEQKVSYFQGYNAVKNFQKNNVGLDEQAFVQAMHDAVAGRSPQLAESEWPALKEQLLKIVKEAQEAEQKQLIETNTAAGQKFLAENQKKEGVKVTDTGLQYKIITAGTGAKPKASDIVTINYVGKLLDGTEFDSSAKKDNKPASLRLDHLILGWKEALQLMPVGSKWEIYIPSYLGYGPKASGKVPPSSTLIFEVELLDTQTPPPDAPKAKRSGKPVLKATKK